MIEWITTHSTELWLIVTTTVALASVIVKLTPNKWDDNALSKVMKVLSLAKKPA